MLTYLTFLALSHMVDDTPRGGGVVACDVNGTHFLGMTKSILRRLWSKKLRVSFIDDSDPQAMKFLFAHLASKHSNEETYPYPYQCLQSGLGGMT